MSDRDRTRPRPPRLRLAGAARPSRRRYARGGASVAPSPRRALRAARAKRSTCATAARASAAWTSRSAIANVDGPIRAALIGPTRSTRPASTRRWSRWTAHRTRRSSAATRRSRFRWPSRMPRRPRSGVPLWRYLAGGEPVTLPLPEIQIFGGGAHAGRRIDLQDLMVMPVGATTFADALAMVAEVYRAAGELMRDAASSPAWRTRAAIGRSSTPTRKRWKCWCARSSAPGCARATTSRSRSTSPPRSSAATAATGWRSTARARPRRA